MRTLYNITIEVLDMQEVWKRGLKHIPAKGIFLKPGDMAVTNTDGYPVIVSTVNEEMLVAHAERADVVDAIIEAFGRRGISPSDITMCIQLHAPGQEDPFMSRAIEAGLRKVWAIAECPIAEFLARADAGIGGRNFVALRRDN